jgi:tetratricopeptide (TPR) repeat protein
LREDLYDAERGGGGKVMWKRAFIFIGLFLAGAVIGGAAVFELVMPTMVKSVFLIQEKEIFELGEAAKEAYFNEPNETAVWALKTYIKSMDKIEAERQAADANKIYVLLSPDDKVIARARLGCVYYRIGQMEKAQEQFKLATEDRASSMGYRFKTQDDWMQLVKQMDSAMKSK